MVLQAIEVPPSYLSAGGQRVSPVLLAGLYGGIVATGGVHFLCLARQVFEVARVLFSK